MQSEDREEPEADREDWVGVVVPTGPEADTNLGFEDPGDLLSEDEKLELDHDLARMHQRRLKAVAKARGIRLS